MKCAEVMEWMHRYLDQDLSQDEIVEMFRHIDNCPSCAEVFERLTLLSKELEQLPDVKPPFSLVDSILPQLAELDRSSREQSAVRTEEPVVVPFSRESSRGKSSKGTSMATRTGIGAIAAAVILGIAIFNMPDKMPGAEVEQMLQDSSKATSDSANNMAIESQAQASTSANSDEAAPADSGTDTGTFAAPPGDDNAALDRAMGPVDPASMPTPAETNAPSGGRSIPEASNGVKPNPTEKVMTPKPDTVTKVQTPDTSGGSNDRSKADKKEQPVEIDKGIAADSADPASPPVEDSLKISNDFGRGVMGFNISNDSNVQTWTSPDGQYAVEFAGLQLVIYKNSQDSVENRSAITSYPLEGNWVSGEWSADSSQFTYVTEKDGVSITKVYTVQEVGNTSSAPAASPSATPEITPTTSSTN
ncbi:zf-HC2 domain-containing protein [Paenibacillus sp. FSL R10-2734]|uniref:anti-sigma factor family protein n=1 Tax=Paenibacillus sp. FSL R10-2734 TaxID=2954691 RepID=UPI0030DA024F